MASFKETFLSKKITEINDDSYSKQLAEDRKKGLLKSSENIIFRDNVLMGIENKQPEVFQFHKKNLQKNSKQLDSDSQEFKVVSKYLDQIENVQNLIGIINENFKEDKIEKISLDNSNLNYPAIKVKFKDVSLFKSFDYTNIKDRVQSIKKHFDKLEYSEGKMQFIKDKENDIQNKIDTTIHSERFVSGYKDAESDFNRKIEEYYQEDKKSLKNDLNAIPEHLNYTDDINQSIWITPDNKLISGEYDSNIRGTDHNSLLDSYNLDRNDDLSWDKIHKMGFVRLVPETKIALVYDNQPFSEFQKEKLEKGGFNIESYGTLEKVKSYENDKEYKQQNDEILER